MTPTTPDLDAIYSGTGEVREPHRFDIALLEEYLCKHLPGFEPPLSVRQFKGGQSNPTYSLGSPAGNWVLRRKPPGELLPSAHAVDREYRVIAALGGSGVPVPRADLLCDDASVVGTPFYVMEQVEGRVFWDPLLPDQSPTERRAIYQSLVDAMAALHGTDLEAIGLGGFGRPGNYFNRQIKRWSKQYVASQTEDLPEMNRLMEWLPENVPADDSVSLVHGDFKLDNTIVHPTEPRVIAVLDWELSTIGHPFGDLTYHLAHRRSPQGGFSELRDAQLRERGIPTVDEYIARYCELTGRDGITDLDFYLAFQLFRSAGIMHGIAGRVKTGTAAGENAEEIGKLAQPLADKALEHARKLGA